MTAFESILLLAVTAIVIITAFGILAIKKMLEEIIDKQGNFDNVVSQLYDIKIEVCQTNGRIDGFIPAFKKLLEHNESIENFWAADSSLVIKLLKEIRNCLTQDINWGELTDNQKSEILYRLTHPVVESPFKPPFKPTCDTTNKNNQS